MPAGQQASLDPHETTELTWMTPAAALAEHQRGGSIVLPPPTQHTLQRLTHWPAADSAWLHLRAEGPGPLLMPWFDPAAPASVMPWDPGHPDCREWLARHHQEVLQMTGVAQPALPCRDRFVVQQGWRTQREVGG